MEVMGFVMEVMGFAIEVMSTCTYISHPLSFHTIYPPPSPSTLHTSSREEDRRRRGKWRGRVQMEKRGKERMERRGCEMKRECAR